MSVKVISDINIPAQMRKIDNDTFWKYSATQWWNQYFNFVPMDTGALAETVKISPKTIEHTVPYANRQYNGKFNFLKNKHPLATGKWDVAAINAGKDKEIIAEMQRYVDSGRLKTLG